MNDGADQGPAKESRDALGYDALRILSEKALKALTGKGALKAALLRVDLWVELKKACEPIELSLLGLDGCFLVIGRSPFLWHGLDEAVELLNLLPRQGAEQKVLGFSEIELLDASDFFGLADLLVVNDCQMDNVFVGDFIVDTKSVTHTDGVLLADTLDGDIRRLKVVEASRQIKSFCVADLSLLCVGHAIDIV